MKTLDADSAPRLTWRWALVAGTALLAGFMLLPQPVRPIAFDVAGVACLLSVLAGVRRHRPARPAPWLLIALGLALWSVANVLYSVNTYRETPVPFPSWADGTYLLAYPAIVAALVIAIRRSPVRDAVAWQDAATWVVAAALLSWEWLVEPVLDGPGTALERGVAVVAPCADVVVLLLLVRLLGSRSGTPGVYRGLVLALSCYLVSDALFGVQVLAGTFQAGSWVDLGWLSAYVGIATVALHPRMVDLAHPQPLTPQDSGRLRLLLLVGVAIVVPTVTAVRDQGTDRDDLALILGGSTALIVLVAWRGARLVGELDRMTDDLRRREVELRRRATSDALTGLANRTALHQRIDEHLGRGEPVSVALVDLDDFKHVNDARGHETGDLLLQQVAAWLLSRMRPDELVTRLGGDEFAVVSCDDPERLGARVADAFVPSDDSAPPVSVSTGVAGSRGAATASELLRHADLAMYTAKRAGGGRAQAYDPAMSAALLDELAVRRDLAEAVVTGGFATWLQPMVDLRTGDLLGFEALARWHRAGGPPLAPDDWLATAELTDVVVEVDAQVLRASARHLAHWARSVPGAAGWDLAVNASGRSLQQPGVAERVLAVLAEEGLSPQRLVLEVTEGVLLDDPAVGARLQQLRSAGVRIALDDFGTGWSSLDYLRRFPVDVLKIDRSFVAGLGSGSATEVLPAVVMRLADALGLDVIAEGVERPEQVEALRALGCRSAQGYLLGPPAPAGDFAELARASVLPRQRPPVGGTAVELVS